MPFLPGRRKRKRVFVLAAVLLSFGVIFVAELGDKSQLMALAFATRYRAVPVLIGITIATALVHLISVVIGGVLGSDVADQLDHTGRGHRLPRLRRLDAAR